MLMWLLCSCSNHFDCCCVVILIHLSFLTNPSIIASLSLNVKYGLFVLPCNCSAWQEAIYDVCFEVYLVYIILHSLFGCLVLSCMQGRLLLSIAIILRFIPAISSSLVLCESVLIASLLCTGLFMACISYVYFVLINSQKDALQL